MEKYIVFLGILRVYQQFSREKIKPERHLIIQRCQERKKTHNNVLHGRESYAKVLKRFLQLLRNSKPRTSLKHLNSPLKTFLT